MVRRKTAAIALIVATSIGAVQLGAQTATVVEKRPAKNLVQPNVSELARKLNLSGSVKIEVTIARDGTVKRTRVLGGHPLLAQDAERAALHSTFEPGPQETIETIEFKFSANN